MRVTDQLVLACALLSAATEANPLRGSSDAKPFSINLVSRPVPAREFRGRHAMNKVLRKYANGNAPPAPPLNRVQKPMKVKGKGKSKAPAGAGQTTANSKDDDQEYVCEVDISGQKLRLNFDTGSSDLWVYSTSQPKDQQKNHQVYDPSKSSNSKELKGGSWSISYGDGSSAGGVVRTDTVTVGGVTSQNQAFGLAVNVSNSFIQDYSNDGLLGLGFTKGTEQGSGNTISVNGKPQPQNTFFTNVRPKLPLPLFTADLKHKAPGSYDFGFIDKSKYTGDIKYFDADSRGAYWGIKSQTYGVKGGQTIKKEIKTIIDTGTTLMLMPQDVLDFYYKQIPNSRNDQNLGGYVFPCSQQIPDFTIGFGSAPNDFTATIPAKYMNFGPAQTSDPTTCFGSMQFMAAGDSLNAIYGDVFLKAVFTVFEAKTDDKPRLGFAMKPEATTSATPATPSPPSQGTCVAVSSNSAVATFQRIYYSVKGWFTKDSGLCPAGSGPDNSPDGGDGSGDNSGDNSDNDGDDFDDDAKSKKGSKKNKTHGKNKKQKKPSKDDDDDDDEEEKPKKSKSKNKKVKSDDDDDDDDE
jgi:aspergillopepsin I